MAKEKTKAELLEEIKKLKAANELLKKENGRTPNYVYNYKFTLEKYSKKYFKELIEKTKLVETSQIVNDSITSIQETRKWPDGNIIVIYYRPAFYKEDEETPFEVKEIDFYDCKKIDFTCSTKERLLKEVE